MKKVGIIMGSKSDLPKLEKAVDILKKFEVPYEVHVFSAHRTPVEARDFSVNARANGFGVIIAAAGMAAHLAGAIAANTTIPVIGIPVNASSLGGMDALLSTVQMPSGVPVATMAINGAKNAAIFAVQIFAVGNAPTALIALEEKIHQGYRPELVIAVPVGFVNVVPAKERIMATGVPYICNRGRKGGSNVAAAICNAILYNM